MAIAAGYSWRAQDPRVRWRSYLATVLVQVLVIAALLWFCFETPLPLPGEEGITVSFGTENSGRNAETPAYIPPATQRVTPAQVEERDESLTQDFEDAPEVRAKPAKEQPKPKQPKPAKPQPTQQNSPKPQQQNRPQEEEPPKPQVNRDALFPSNTPQPPSEGQGSGGAIGNQGRYDGSTAGAGSGAGQGQGTGGKGQGAGPGGSGISYSLGGRVALQLPSPEYPNQKSGKVVVRVRVNRHGAVVSAEAGVKGSTTLDASLLAAAQAAALRANFDVQSDAPETQVGTITYIFKIKQ